MGGQKKESAGTSNMDGRCDFSEIAALMKNRAFFTLRLVYEGDTLVEHNLRFYPEKIQA